MIKKPKLQLYNLLFIHLLLLFAVLLGFFVFAAFFQPHFFFYLSGALAVNLFVITTFQYLFIRKQAELALHKEDFLEKANLLEAEIADEKISIESFRRKINSYSYLKEITEELSLSFSMEDTVKVIYSEIEKLFGGEDVVLTFYLFHSKTGEIGVPLIAQADGKADLSMKKGDMYDKWVIKTMTPLLVEDARSDFRFDVNKIEIESSRLIRSLMSVPLMIEHRAIGILRLESLRENAFNMEDIRVLTALGDIGAVALENAQLCENIEDLAVKDSLTGLFLRRYLEDTLVPDINAQLSQDKMFSFLMIDLDKFKVYNDSYGHTAGDIVLKKLSKILTGMFKDPGNFVVRYGGEEFLVVLPDCPAKNAIKIAEHLRSEIQSAEIVFRRKKTCITASIGVAGASDEAKDVEKLIASADAALYKAKKKGRNKVCG